VAVLDRHHPPGREAAAVADAVNFVDDGDLGVARQQEIGMERMRRPTGDVLHGAAGGDQGLPDHLAAEHPLPSLLRRAAAKQVHLDRLEIENGEEILDG